MILPLMFEIVGPLLSLSTTQPAPKPVISAAVDEPAPELRDISLFKFSIKAYVLAKPILFAIFNLLGAYRR